jgi:DNA-binding LytR/AlgR family response regulator
MNIVIIEDEAKTAADLKDTIQKVDSSAKVLITLDSIESSVEYFRNHLMPDLVFSDIQLADGLSFQIFKSVTVSCPVIFCTAFDEYAIEAFRANGIDYILKPFDEQTIKNSLIKIKKLEMHFSSQNDLFIRMGTALLNQKSYKSAFLVSYKDKMIPISTSDIACVYIADEAIRLITFSNQKFGLDYTLDEIENMLDPKLFYRVNRQYILHFIAITEIEHYFARKLIVKVSVPVPETIVVSKARASDFLRWMENR